MDNPEWTIKNGQSRMDNPEWTIKHGQSRMDNPELTIQNGQSRMDKSEWTIKKHWQHWAQKTHDEDKQNTKTQHNKQD